MFYLTDSGKKNSVDANDYLYKVFDQSQEMCNTKFMDKGIRLPTSQASGNRVYGNGEFGIFNNLPAPKVYIISGYECTKIGNIMTHNLADGQGFEFTETSCEKSNGPLTCICDNIHGYRTWMN